MRVKICGITNLADALLCQSYGADALGFIFYRKSPRYISVQKTAGIISKLSVFLTKVGVFVNESPNLINDVAEKAGLNAVQLHGDEPADVFEKIRVPVIKSFRVKPGFDFSQIAVYDHQTILLDTYSENEYGGTGSIFDWKKIPVSLRPRIIIAGGVSSKNIAQIHREINPAAVDLSSSLESTPGKKDSEKVKQFFKQLRQLT